MPYVCLRYSSVCLWCFGYFGGIAYICSSLEVWGISSPCPLRWIISTNLQVYIQYMSKKFKLLDPLHQMSIPKPNATILLFLAAILAVIIANSPWQDAYKDFLNFEMEVSVFGFELFKHHGHTMSLFQFVNDFLMALFFFNVGLEIKQEMMVGELSSFNKSILPVIAAVGGMIMPVLFFLAVEPSSPGSLGAAIPMATDIAFALALIGALGDRVPTALRVFIMALAVVDDIGGIIIIALFYSSSISWVPLLIAFGILGLIVLFGKLGVEHPGFYMLMFFVVWQFFNISGIHTTIAGVLVALCVPLTTKVRIDELQLALREQFASLKQDHKEGRGAVVLSHDQMGVTSRLRSTLSCSVSPVQTIEHMLSPIISYFVLPLFAFVNAGVSFDGISSDGLLGVPLAIFLGLFLGKTVGISLFTWLAIRLKVCSWPTGMNLRRLIPLSAFGGIGFTVSLFIATLSYGPLYPDLLNQAKLGIFAGTIVSGLVGYIWLDREIKRD